MAFKALWAIVYIFYGVVVLMMVVLMMIWSVGQWN